ncbi:MAG TPA: ABC transporter substrate-binding protein [Trebonia sp.]|nr:ABC transporter substrate-binding protein [Trebonia sp.]
MKYMIKQFLSAAAVAAVAITALAACAPAASNGGGSSGGAGTGSTASGSVTDVTIQISGAAAPYYAPIYEAISQGFFRKNGLNVTLGYAEDANIVQNVAAGNVQFGFPNGAEVITAKGNGVNVNVIDTTYQQGIDALMFNAKRSGITSPADLKGKTVAITALGSPDYIDLQAMLKSAGLSLSDIHLKLIGTGAIVQALQRGQVDAIEFSRLRYFALQSAGFPVGEILADNYMPSFGNVLITNSSYLKSNPAVAKDFVAALHEGIQYVIAHPAQSVSNSISKYATTFAGQDAAITQVIEQVYIPQLWQSAGTKAHGLGYGDLARWQSAIKAQLKYGLIKKSYSAGSLVVEPGDL